MRNLYKLCLGTFFMMSMSYAAFAQKTDPETKLGNVKSLLNTLQEQAAPSKPNQKNTKPEFKLQVAENKFLDAKINFQKSENTASQSVMGEVTGTHSGSFYIKVEENILEGNIVLKEEKKAYKYFSDGAGNAYVKEVDIDGVLCIDFEHGSSPVTQPSEPAGAQAAQIGQALLNLQSFPGAAGCVLLDFDGHNMPAGNLWNNGNAINAAHSGMSDAAVQEHWEVVSEDFRPFNLNVTTSESVFNSYPRNRRMRCVITPTNTAAPGAGGVAYIGSFNWNNDVPCWVFITSGKSGGEASSHEIGHTFGLWHDGRENPDEGYFSGHGDWAPIMGVGYYRNVTQWSRGEYNRSNNKEDDLSIISSTTYGVGYRADDYGNTISSAGNLVYDANGNVSSSQNRGIIERTTDLDFFAFNTSGGNITLNVNTVSRHGNLDILVRLYNSSGAQIGAFNPPGLNAIVTANLGAGRYYISVDGTGAGNPATDGYSDYASLGSYFISGNIPPVVASGNAVATFYKDCNYGGYAVGLEEGSYTVTQLQARGIQNDDISSLKVRLGYRVFVYLDNNFLGGSKSFIADDACLVDDGFNDLISSVRIVSDGVTNLAGTYKLQNRHSSLFLDVNSASTSDGARVQQWTGNSCACQNFVLSHLGSGIYRILAEHSGKSLDVSGPSTADGTPIVQWSYASGSNQQFRIVAAGDGFYKLIPQNSHKILEIAGRSTQTGAIAQQWTDNGQTSGHWKLVPVVVTPPAFTTTIQAENYSAMSGVQTEPTTDTGGGQNVGYVDNGDWMAYNSINFPSTGTYKVEYRVASVGGGRISLDLNAGSIVLGALNVPNTGGWQNWTTISHNVNVNAGTYNLGIFAELGGWNLNWIRITRVANASAAVAIAAEAESADASVNYGTAGAAKLELYPNPVEHELTLLTNYDLSGAYLKIFDASGTVVMESSNPAAFVNVSELGQGIFTLMLITKDNSKVIQRFAKQ